MLLVALIVVALLAVAVLGLFVSARSSAVEFRLQAEQRELALEGQRDQLRSEKAELSSEKAGLSSEKATLQNELTSIRRDNERLQEQSEAAHNEIRGLGGELDKSRAVSEQQNERIEAQANRILEAEGEVSSLQSQLEVAETAAASAAARASGVVIGELEGGGARPETLWNLELTRSERTWRTSVSTNPEADGSPFEATEDPLRLAVEIEASALRENVGAFITIDWKAGLVEDPTQRHLIVRVAQELLESAARSPEPSVLRASQDDNGEIVLSLESANDAAHVINIIPPQITSDLLHFKAEAGLSVTVKAQ